MLFRPSTRSLYNFISRLIKLQILSMGTCCCALEQYRVLALAINVAFIANAKHHIIYFFVRIKMKRFCPTACYVLTDLAIVLVDAKSAHLTVQASSRLTRPAHLSGLVIVVNINFLDEYLPQMG